MARPVIPKGKKRSINFTFRLTEEEVNKLALLSEIYSKTPGAIIREKVFQGRFPELKTAKVDVNTYLELKKIGINLNQLVKRIHSGLLPSDLLVRLDELLKQQGIIIQLLLHDRQPENR